MLRDFDDFRWAVGGDLSLGYGFVQGCTPSASGGTGGRPSIVTTTLLTDDFGNGIYNGTASTSRTGIAMARCNFTVADTGTAGVIEVWQGERALAVRPSGNDLQLWTINDGVLATAAGVISSGVFAKVELKWTMSSLDPSNLLNADGSLTLRVNDIQVASVTGRQIGYALPAGHVRDVQWNVVVINPHGNCDMQYLCDGAGSRNTDFLGAGVDVFYATAIPGNGTFQEMTPSADTDHGVLVSDAVDDGDGTYLSLSGQARKDSFNHQDFASVAPKVILGVKHTASCKKVDSGYRRARSFMVRNGVIRYATRDYPIGVDYFNWQQDIKELDPFTGARFTIEEINASEFGVLIG